MKAGHGPEFDPSAEAASSKRCQRSSLAQQPVTDSVARGAPVMTVEPMADAELGVCFNAFTWSSITDDAKPTASRSTSSRSGQTQDPGTESVGPDSLASRPPLRSNEDFRIVKRRRENRKDMPARKQSFNPANKAGAYQLTEEKLFELMIARIRQREESEAVAADFQRQMKTHNFQLQEENQDLRQQLEKCHEHLQRTLAELKETKSRTDNWKSKLHKFKQVVNDLGHEYDLLRGDFSKFKETTKSLEKEKGDLMEAIDSTRVQVSRAENAMDEQRDKISQDEKELALLRQALASLEEKDQVTKVELAKERKRATTLELYIQTYARDQTKQLVCIKESQGKLLAKLDSGFESVVEESTSSKEKMVAEIRTVFEEFRSSVQILSDKCSAERMDVQDFTNTAHDVVSR